MTFNFKFPIINHQYKWLLGATNGNQGTNSDEPFKFLDYQPTIMGINC